MVRTAAFGIGAIAILLAIPTQRLNIALLVALAFAIAASANLPALLSNLSGTGSTPWARGLQHLLRIDHGSAAGHLLTGRVWYANVAVPSANFDWFPLPKQELISIPSGFLCGLVGTLISKEVHPAERYDEMSVRAFTGAGAE